MTDPIAPSGPPEGGASRRMSERKTLRTVAKCQVMSQAPWDVRTLDLSLTGMAVVMPYNPPISAACIIHFGLMLKGVRVPVQVHARVVHSIFSGPERGFKVGLQFVNLPSAVQSTLGQYLEA